LSRSWKGDIAVEEEGDWRAGTMAMAAKRKMRRIQSAIMPYGKAQCGEEELPAG
jgi:hypothetical protein